MTGNPVLLAERKDSVLWLTMNRPTAANALDASLHDALVASLGEADADHAVRGVVLRGQGSRVFSAGADLKEFSDLPLEVSRPRRRDLLGRTLHGLAEFGKPLVACVNGKAVGAGCMLALLADEVYVVDGAQLSLPEILLGTPTPVGATIVAMRAGHRAAHRLVQSAERIDAQAAVALGLADALLEGEAALELRCQARVLALASNSPEAYRQNKLWMNAALCRGIADALDLSARLQTAPSL